MQEWFHEFWTTRSGFERTMRSLGVFVGLLLGLEMIPVPGPPGAGRVLGALLQGGAVFIPAGNKNLDPATGRIPGAPPPAPVVEAPAVDSAA